MRELESDTEILAFLSRDPFLHLYSIGDLDPFFRPQARYFAWPAAGAPRSVFLLFAAPRLPVLLAFEEQDPPAARELLRAFAPSLPSAFYAQVSPHLEEELARHRRLEPHGTYVKMGLGTLSAPPPDPTGARYERLGEAHLELLLAFYRQAYPRNWFDRRMLATGQFLGGFEGDRLMAVAGIHVYAPAQRVAALGNIAVAPDARGRGWAKAVSHRLCVGMRGIDRIGLNVATENEAAIRAYEAIGFRRHAVYREFGASVS